MEILDTELSDQVFRYIECRSARDPRVETSISRMVAAKVLETK
jgi:hypothetical protein